MDGLLIVDKPAGWTSFDVVAFVRRRTGVRRVGHGGTLDPAATGVLPIFLGQATRLVEYLVDASKTYVAEITLGVSTNTYDAEGDVVTRTDASHVARGAIETALQAFQGQFEQVPPAFSAIKRAGQPLYKLARRGEAVELVPRAVNVERLDMLSYDPPVLRLEIDCSKGFYVRSLANDLGQSLGVGAILSGLVRTRVGDFGLKNATGIDGLTEAFEAGDWPDLLCAPDEVLLDWHAAIVAEMTEQRLRNGLSAAFPTAVGALTDRCRAYTQAGKLLALLRRVDATSWRPEKVFNLSDVR